MQGRQLYHLSTVLGEKQYGLVGLNGRGSRGDRGVLVLPAVENRHGITVTLALVSRQGVGRPIGHSVDICCLTTEILVLYPIRDGIDDIAHIGDAVPREPTVTIGKIGHGGIGLVGREPCRDGIKGNRGVEAVLEPDAQLPYLAINNLFLVPPVVVAEIDHARITAGSHRLTHDTSLLDILSKRPSVLIRQPLADENVTVELRRNLTPPGSNPGISTRRFPIDLWSQEVDSAARYPSHWVAVNLVILPVTAYGTRVHAIPIGNRLGGTCHTGRADAEAHPRLGRLDHIVHVLDHLVDVLTPPVTLRHRAARRPVGVIQVGIKRERRIVLIIKIIVKHQSIDVIFHQNILADVHHSLPHLGDAGVEHRLITGRQQPFGMGIDIVPLALAPHVVTVAVAIGIDPSIDLDAALVGLGNEILQRVKRGCHATGSRNVT